VGGVLKLLRGILRCQRTFRNRREARFHVWQGKVSYPRGKGRRATIGSALTRSLTSLLPSVGDQCVTGDVRLTLGSGGTVPGPSGHLRV
jgi:hypothetical protein